MGSYNIGKIIIYLGLVLVIMGGIIYYFGGFFSWVGHLPGDIRVEKENFRFYFPITTMIVISIVINLLLRFIRLFIK